MELKNTESYGIMIALYLPVAQLDSARDSDSRGRRFESCRVGQKEKSRKRLFLFVLFTLHFSLKLPRDFSREKIREKSVFYFIGVWTVEDAGPYGLR